MVKEQQTERLGIRVTPSEVEMLELLSELSALSMSNVVRQLIRKEYAERVGELPGYKLKRRPKPKR